MSEEVKKSNKGIWIILIIALVFLLIVAGSQMINIIVLDPQPFNNLTLMINIT